MELKKLGEIFKITSGSTPSKKNREFYEGGSIPWIKTGDLKKKYLNDSAEYITELALNNSSVKKFPKNTVLIAMYGATIGATSILKIDATTNQACAAFLPNDLVIPEYLYYFFKANKKKIINLGVGGAQPNISGTILKEIEFPLCSIETQNKIVEVLDKAQDLIDKKIEQIDLLDELVKSRFIEMFGNVISNSKHWKMKQLKDIAILKSGGTPSRKEPKYFQGEIPWITTVSLGKNIIDENDAVEFITQEAIEKSSTKLIESNSLLFGIRVGVGKISINKIPMCTNQDIVAITKIDENEYNLICLKKIIENYSDYFNNQKRGATIQGIKSETLKNINIPILPIELQNEFAVFVEKIDSIKAAAEKSLEQLNDNFNSLIQKAFKGELF